MGQGLGADRNTSFARPAESIQAAWPKLKFLRPGPDDFDPTQPPARELIGRKAELAQLRHLYQQFVSQKHGHFSFILSRPGYGRHALVQTLANEVKSQPNNTVISLNFAEKPTPATAEWPHTTQILGGFWLDLVAQFSQALGYQARPDHGLADMPETLVNLLRRLTQKKQQRVLLLLENFDRAPSALLSSWRILINYLAKEMVKDLPVFLIMTLTAPQPLAQLAADDLNETLRFIQSLAPHPMWLDRLTSAEIASYTGALEPTLLEQLCHLSNGVSAWVEDLWQDWQETAVIKRRPDGRWYAQEEILSNIRLYLKQRLTPHLAEQAEFTFEQVEDILGCGSLEGVTFTAQAVAQVLQLDLDRLMNFVEEYLLDDPEQLGVLLDGEEVQYPEPSHLYQYRFSRPYLWHLAQHYLANRDRWQRELAEVLESQYAEAKEVMAETLIRLFTATGQPQRAEPYRAMLRQLVSNFTAMQWQEHLLSQFADSDFERYRLYALRLELTKKLYDTGHYREALPYAQAALIMAERWHDSLRQANCMNWVGELLRAMGEYAAARPYYERALAIYAGKESKSLDLSVKSEDLDSLPATPHVAMVLSNLGLLLDDMGDYAAARPYYERALAIREQVLGATHPSTATSLNNLGFLLNNMGDYAAARPYLERALAIREQVLGATHPSTATSLNNLGGLLKSMGEYAAARPYYERALAIREQLLGATHPNTAQSLNNLAWLCYNEGDMAGGGDFGKESRAATSQYASGAA